ncbi:MAG: isoprenylcysteine carboxylmethyltransferase family protein [Acidobacteria bacterium]|nr:isoprenylcysteine carboxylmethyltransferase family protein [Acidobacteriota bacterium]
MSTAIQKLRVPIGFAFAFAYLILAEPSPLLLLPGLGVAASGLLLRVWAAGYLTKFSELSRSGPYTFTRNPLYLGSFLMGLGFCIAGGNTFFLMFFIVLFVAVYVPVMKREEKELLQLFGTAYEDYRSQVPLFFPRFKRTNLATESNFNWQQVILNAEYRSIAGFLVVAVLIFLKSLWR